MNDLHDFIVHAKAKTYVGGAEAREPCRPGSHDVGFDEGEWSYLDSYFGGADFVGQEVVWRSGEPVWSMTYYGRILDAARIDAARAGSIIREALSAMYGEGRFLGGFEWTSGEARYVDWSDGNVDSFRGFERIFIAREEVYRLDYFGGLIRP
jgi:hypothetical protein